MKTQKAEADRARPSTFQAPPVVGGRPAGVYINASAAVEDADSSSDKGYHATVEGGPEADNRMIGADMVKDEWKGLPQTTSSCLVSTQPGRIHSEADATTSVPKPPEFGVTPPAASCKDQSILLQDIEGGASPDVEPTDPRVLSQHSSPVELLQNVAVLPAQEKAISELQTGGVSGPIQIADTAVVGQNLLCKLQDISAQSIDGSAAPRSVENNMLEEGEILEISGTSFFQSVQEKKRKRPASALADYSPRSPEEREEYIESLIHPASPVLYRRRGTISMLSGIDGIGRGGSQSAKAADPPATASATTCAPVISPPFPQRPMFRNRSVSPRETRGETRAEAFERAKAKGLIPGEMTYSDLLQLDVQSRLDDRRLSKVAKRAWEEAGRPPLPAGYTHNSRLSYVYALVQVPDVIRGPEAKRRRVGEGEEQGVKPTVRRGYMPDTRAPESQPRDDKEAVKEQQARERVKPTSRLLEVQDFIRLMAGKKRRE